MPEGAVRSWPARLRRAFRRREIFLRDEGQIRYLPISTRAQVIAATLVFAFTVTALGGLFGTAVYRQAAVDRGRTLAFARAEYSQNLLDMEGLASQLASPGQAPDDAAVLVRELLRQDLVNYGRLFPDQSGDAALATLAVRMAPSLVPDRLTLAGLHGQLLRRAESAEAKAAALIDSERRLIAGLDEARRDLSAVEDKRNEAVSQIASLNDHINALQAGLTAAQERGNALAADLSAAHVALDREFQRNWMAANEREALKAQIEGLEQQAASYHTAQANWLAALGAHTQDSIALVENVVAMTGVNVDKLVARVSHEPRASSGGPFVPVSLEQPEELPDPMSEMATDISRQVERWEALKRVVRILPLSSPLDNFTVISRFGRRIDPFNGHWAMHTGLDLKAPLKTPVMSTSPGRVVYAGWAGDYGRLVEIDHGYGIHTRYAHLAQISVAVGDEVGHRAVIGALGSSGRSTGPHVHYEVLVDGKPMNPMKFLEAARYVFKN